MNFTLCVNIGQDNICVPVTIMLLPVSSIVATVKLLLTLAFGSYHPGMLSVSVSRV